MNRIKVASDKSRYLLSGEKWVRDFTKSAGKDINKLYDRDSIRKSIENETVIRGMNLPLIDRENYFHSDVVIVSDGFDVESCKDLINFLGKNKTVIIGVNGVMSCSLQIRPSFYLINEIDSDAMSYFPARMSILPPLIASVRSHPEFVSRYKARRAAVYNYVPTGSDQFSSKLFSCSYTVDDYRNPICAALNLAFRWGANRILLLAPHDLFKENREGTKKINSGLYIYPQQMTAHNFVDGCLHWLKEYNGCESFAVTSGPEFTNAKNVSSAEATRIFSKG